MNLGVQYYRAPFPNQKYWNDDFAKIRNSGLDTVQLWVLWSWVESKPDTFDFDEYDRLMELAAKHGLSVILSTIAELQPLWIHRVVPDSEMIDHEGKKVISTNRCECHFGITPGGCTDHPGVWERMQRFLSAVTERYKDAPNLYGWDAWNELRWNVHADGLVCFCPHTIAAYRKYLEHKYHGLDGLNEAWKRRYVCWEDVTPGKLPNRPYTELMAWQNFITERANHHGWMRYDLIKTIDRKHPVTAHGADPSVLSSGGPGAYPLDRGNDWMLADKLDGIGCSSFPQWLNIDDVNFGMRIEMVKSAAHDKRVWLSELQGGRGVNGFDIHGDVNAVHQQRWIWNGLACGADTILFWCWRDEVFGRESSGFGLAGCDGLAEERLAAMKITGDLLQTHAELFDDYQPDRAEVGLLFSPQAYYLAWAQESSAMRITEALKGYASALLHRSIAVQFIEEEHLEKLDAFKVIMLPRMIVTDKKQEDALLAYVKNGGTLVCESECGAFAPNGIYRYPEERFPASCGITETGRRILNTSTVRVSAFAREYELDVEQWLTPLKKSDSDALTVMAESDGLPLIASCPVGRGRIIYCGSYFGNPYREKRRMDFEEFLEAIALEAGVTQNVRILVPEPTKEQFIYLKCGHSGNGHILFVFFPENLTQAELEFDDGIFPSDRVVDLLTGQDIKLTRDANGRRAVVTPGRFQLALLTDKA